MKDGQPQSLLEVIRFFADERRAFECVRDRRWPNGVTCPRCGSDKVRFMESRMAWNCNGCRKQFTAKTGTVFEDSPIKFSKWLPAMWLIANCKNGISSYELARDLQVTQKTAWFMLHRIRLAMQEGTFEMLGDDVEVDEAYIGGKAINMHRGPRRKLHSLGGGMGKELVIGFLERGGKVRTKHMPGNYRSLIENTVRENVKEGSNLYTDAHGSYRFMNQWYAHQFVDHAVEYARGAVHTNSLENYWSCLKRSIHGTYVSVEPFHLHRYLDEQAFRYNERFKTDGERFVLVVSSVTGKRLTYSSLTGKELAADRPN